MTVSMGERRQQSSNSERHMHKLHEKKMAADAGNHRGDEDTNTIDGKKKTKKTFSGAKLFYVL